MRAWHYTACVLVVVACGGTDITDDGGLGDGATNDVQTIFDGGNGQDVDMTVDTGTPDDAAMEATVEAGPFTPTNFGSNLVLWLDAAKGITLNTNVATWADQTSYKNDAQGGTGMGSHQPTVTMNAINTLPAVTFANNTNNAQQYLTITDSTSLQWGTGDFALFMVASYTNALTGNGAGQGTFYVKVAGNTLPTGPELLANAGAGGNALDSNIRARINANDNVNSTMNGYNDNKFHRVGIRRNAGIIEVWADATTNTFTPDAGGPPNVSAAGSDANIGGASNGQFADLLLRGMIAEVIGVMGATSASDMSGLDGYFKSKYAL